MSRTISPKCPLFFVYISMSFISMSKASNTKLRVRNKRNLRSQCEKSCNSNEIVRVLVETANETGKNNALECSMSGSANTDIKIGDGYILGFAVCPDDRTALEESEGVFFVEDDQVMTTLDSDCKKDCNSDEIDRVLVTTRDEAGKENALMCSMTSMTDKGGDTEKRRDEGYILGIGICPDDKTALENLEGVFSVEDDQDMTVLDSDCKKDCSSDEIERVLVQTADETGKENALMCSMTSMTNKDDVVIEMTEGYILGIGICPDDRIALQNSEGVMLVEDDRLVRIVDKEP